MKKHPKAAKAPKKTSDRLPLSKQRGLEAIIDHLSIHLVRLDSMHAEREACASEIATGGITVNSEGAIASDKSSNWLVYIFAFETQMELKKTSAKEGSREGVVIRAKFRIVYSIDSKDLDLSESEISDFGRFVACGNVWPYWRELVQSVTVRMGLPPLMMPLVTPKQLAATE